MIVEQRDYHVYTGKLPELVRLYADEVIWGIVHSHTHTPAVPSPTDIGLAFYPDALYLLVSLSDDEADPVTGAPSIRAWRIVDDAIHEVDLGS